jgi:hypothetical protein
MVEPAAIGGPFRKPIPLKARRKAFISKGTTCTDVRILAMPRDVAITFFSSSLSVTES